MPHSQFANSTILTHEHFPSGVAFASDLSWEPGYWPKRVTLHQPDGSMLIYRRDEDFDPEEGVVYTGRVDTITVYND